MFDRVYVYLPLSSEFPPFIHSILYKGRLLDMFDSVYIYLPLSSEFPPFVHGARSRVGPGILVGHCMGHGLLQKNQRTK